MFCQLGAATLGSDGNMLCIISNTASKGTFNY